MKTERQELASASSCGVWKTKLNPKECCKLWSEFSIPAFPPIAAMGLLGAARNCSRLPDIQKNLYAQYPLKWWMKILQNIKLQATCFRRYAQAFFTRQPRDDTAI